MSEEVEEIAKLQPDNTESKRAKGAIRNLFEIEFKELYANERILEKEYQLNADNAGDASQGDTSTIKSGDGEKKSVEKKEIEIAGERNIRKKIRATLRQCANDEEAILNNIDLANHQQDSEELNVLKTWNMRLGVDVPSRKSMLRPPPEVLNLVDLDMVMLRTESQILQRNWPCIEQKPKKTEVMKIRVKDRLNAEEINMNMQVMDRMMVKQNFLKTCRFKEADEQQGFSCFSAPCEVGFTDYIPGHMYTKRIKLVNLDPQSRRVRIIPPRTQRFHASLTYPDSSTGLVATGNYALLTIEFIPESLANFNDKITIMSERGRQEIKLFAMRRPPLLTLPKKIEFEPCLSQEVLKQSIVVHNKGGPARFIVSKIEDHPEGMLRRFDAIADEEFVKPDLTRRVIFGPFSVSPAYFFLRTGASITISITVQAPVGCFEEKFSLLCDNETENNYVLKAEAFEVKVSLHKICDRLLHNLKGPVPIVLGKTNPVKELLVLNSTPISYRCAFFLQNEEVHDELITDVPQYVSAGPNVETRVKFRYKELETFQQRGRCEIPGVFKLLDIPVSDGIGEMEIFKVRIILLPENTIPPVLMSDPPKATTIFPGNIEISCGLIDFGLLNFGDRNCRANVEFSILNSYSSAASIEFCIPNPQICLTPQTATILSNSRVQILAKFLPTRCQQFRENIRLIVTYDEARKSEHLIGIRGEVQAPHVELSELSYQLGECFVTVERTVAVVVKNFTNLPSHYRWESIQENDKFDVVIIPEMGDLAEKSEVCCKITFIFKLPGLTKAIFLCNVKGRQALPFQITADVKGLSVSFHVNQNRARYHRVERILNKINHQKKMGVESVPQEYLTRLEKYFPDTKELPLIDFGDTVDIYKQSRLYLVLRNHSAVNTKFKLLFEKLGTDIEFENFDIFKDREDDMSSYDGDDAMTVTNSVGSTFRTLRTSRTDRSILSGGSTHRSNTTTVRSIRSSRTDQTLKSLSTVGSKRSLRMTSMTNQNILGEEPQTFKGSMAGKRFIEEKQNAKLVERILGNKGCKFAIRPSEGVILPWSCTRINLTCLNSMCGQYEDRLKCEIEGESISAKTQQFWLTTKVEVVGSPLSFALGIQPPQGEIPLLQWAPVFSNSGSHQKNIRVINKGTFPMLVKFKVYDAKKIKIPEIDNGLEISESGRVRFSFTVKPPSNDCLSTYFSILPSELVVPAGGFSCCSAIFTSESDKVEFTQKALLTSSILMHPQDKQKITSSSNVSEINVEEVAENGKLPDWVPAPKTLTTLSMDFVATVVEPKLEVDKHTWFTMDGPTKGLRFDVFVTSSGLKQIQQKQLTLINRQYLLVSFRVLITKGEEHFQINERDANQLMRPDSSRVINVRLAFGQQSLEKTPVQPEYSFEGELQIRFANGITKETFPLKAFIHRPHIHIHAERFAFLGTEVGQEKTFNIRLENRTKVLALWKLVHIKRETRTKGSLMSSKVLKTLKAVEFSDITIDDPAVFLFSSVSGSVKPRNLKNTYAPPASKYLSTKNYKQDSVLAYDKTRESPELLVRFVPNKEGLFRSSFRITVKHGSPQDFTLSGEAFY